MRPRTLLLLHKKELPVDDELPVLHGVLQLESICYFDSAGALHAEDAADNPLLDTPSLRPNARDVVRDLNEDEGVQTVLHFTAPRSSKLVSLNAEGAKVATKA